MDRRDGADQLGDMRGRGGLRKLLSLVGATVAFILLSASSAMAANPGALDSSFGSGGIASGPAGARFFGSAAQSDGKVIAVGVSNAGTADDVLLERFTTSGAADGSFGSGGIVHGPTIDSGGIVGSLGRAVAIQSDGKVVVVGKATGPDGSGQLGLLVERFNANGSLDSSFGSGGVVHVATGTDGDGYAVAIQSNGQILAAGSIQPSGGGTSRALIVRLNANGGLDTSFGSAGIDTVDLGVFSVALGMGVQPDGKIVLVGSQSPQIQAVNAVIGRVTSSGALDPSFGGTGVVAKQYAQNGAANSVLNAVTIQSNGEIVAAGAATDGAANADAVFARFTSSGGSDGGFGSGGVAYRPSATSFLGATSAIPGATAVDQASNGDLVAAGFSQSSLQTSTTLWALTPSGAPVSSFGGNGTVTTGAGAGSSEVGSLSIASDGNLVVAGDSHPLTTTAYTGLVARYGGFGAPTPPSLKVALKSLKGSYAIKSAVKSGVKFGVNCNQACKIQASLVASASTAKTLGMGRSVKRCKKVKGRRRCTTKRTFAKKTLVKSSSSQGASGTHTFVLKFNAATRRALGRIKKHHSVKLTLTVAVTTSASKKAATINKTITLKA